MSKASNQLEIIDQLRGDILRIMWKFLIKQLNEETIWFTCSSNNKLNRVRCMEKSNQNMLSSIFSTIWIEYLR
ncbi:unnamed protein product [Caenorhabditis angaria]|uniref:Uncharacterized protein n=1 Tax=Caenorhabditis angaria TaxID=860376 RepID=A0A9P1IZA9_9PELO|nr:unnamed protein product [Caenorhabditis angaria]